MMGIAFCCGLLGVFAVPMERTGKTQSSSSERFGVNESNFIVGNPPASRDDIIQKLSDLDLTLNDRITIFPNDANDEYSNNIASPIKSGSKVTLEGNYSPEMNYEHESEVFKVRELLRACESGNVQKVKDLIANGADVNAKGKQSRSSALLLASIKSHLDVVQELVNNPLLDINIEEGTNTALGIAITMKNLPLVNILLQRKDEINFFHFDRFGASYLLKNVLGIGVFPFQTKYEISKKILEALPNDEERERLINYSGNDLSPVASQEMARKQYEMVKLYLCNGANDTVSTFEKISNEVGIAVEPEMVSLFIKYRKGQPVCKKYKISN